MRKLSPTTSKKTKREAPVDIIAAVADGRLIGDQLSDAQTVALKSLYGLGLTRWELDIYSAATGRAQYQRREYREATYICGRRAGKSSKLGANAAIFEAAFRKHTLAPGERGHVVTIAQTQRQARVCFSYILARLEKSPTLRTLIQGEPRADEVDLTNGITISVWPASFRSIRGISIVAAICDEVGFWRDDVTGANPSGEILRAIRPAMATFPEAKLIKISSPYAKSGPVWEDYQKRFERDDLLVWKMDSATMNPGLDRAFLAEEEKRDPESFAREYLAEFYEAASALLPVDSVEACIMRGRREIPPTDGKFCFASLDAAFRGDAFAFAIVHGEGEKIVQDVIRSWRGSRSRPVDLASTLGEIVATLRQYRIGKIYGDSFCSEPIRQALAVQGVQFEQATTLGTRAAGIWNSLRTLVTAGNIELLDDPEQILELKRLELILTRSGNQRVEASSGHDDKAVALALAAHQCVSRPVREPWVSTIEVPQRGSALGGGEPLERGWTRIS